MMKTRELQKYLKSNDFELLRTTGKHNIYQHKPTGRKLSTSNTSSDRMSFRQVIRDVERILGRRACASDRSVHHRLKSA